MEDLCYYYESPYRNFSPELKLIHDVLQHQVAKWKERNESGKALLTYQEDGDGMVVSDTRWRDEPAVHRFHAIHRAIGGILRTGASTNRACCRRREAWASTMQRYNRRWRR